MRPTIGVAGGGVFLFDDTAWFHMETPYYVNYSNTPIPRVRDLRDFTFPSGQRIEMVEPFEHYRLTFATATSSLRPGLAGGPAAVGACARQPSCPRRR